MPVWVFKPADAVHATAGLVMNVSDGGVQVLTASDAALDRAGEEGCGEGGAREEGQGRIDAFVD